MRLPDPATSRAVLIGVHDYEHLPPLESVKNNLNRLRDALTDPELWGLPKEHCKVLPQPLGSVDSAGPTTRRPTNS